MEGDRLSCTAYYYRRSPGRVNGDSTHRIRQCRLLGPRSLKKTASIASFSHAGHCVEDGWQRLTVRSVDTAATAVCLMQASHSD
jgi:hypothetical protein